MTGDDPLDLSRKSPRQARARQTVETLLDTTAQILVEEGSEKLTTNRLAEKAGYSIGTVYQYFPNRQAIVLALIERQRAKVGRQVQAVLTRSAGQPLEQRIRAILHVLHEAFTLHRKPARRLMRALIEAALAHGLPTPPNVAAEAIIEVWREASGGMLNESEHFVLTRAIIEVLRQAVMSSSPLLGTRDFEDALLRMILGFLKAAPDQSG